MRVPNWLKDSIEVIGMFLLLGICLAVTSVVALTVFTVLQAFVNRWLASLL